MVHKNKWYSVVHEKFLISKNKTGDYFLVKHAGSSIIIPIKDNKIIFEKQYRYPTKKWSLELPCGGREKGVSFLETAKKELQEETGYKAKSIKKIGSFYPSPGNSARNCNVYLAKNLEFIKKNLEKTEHITTVELTKEDAYKMAGQGKITDGFTLSALIIARELLIKYKN